jgi:hypothetical protein
MLEVVGEKNFNAIRLIFFPCCLLNNTKGPNHPNTSSGVKERSGRMEKKHFVDKLWKSFNLYLSTGQN